MRRLSLRTALVSVSVAACLFLWSGSATAKSVTFNCQFDASVSPEGLANPMKKTFKLQFQADSTTGKAVLVGDRGVEEVLMIPGTFGLSFVEKLPTGALQTTTVLKDGSAVHSRHTALSDNQLAPSQYYGKCQ